MQRHSIAHQEGHQRAGQAPSERAVLGLTEHLLMLALIVIVVIAIVALLGTRISALYAMIDVGLLH